MHKAAKLGMMGWSILCFLGACSGMMNVASKMHGQMSDAEAFGAGLGLFFWLLIWFFPTAGMGIVALVTRPKPYPLSTAGLFSRAYLCPYCGKYQPEKENFCRYCGKAQS